MSSCPICFEDIKPADKAQQAILSCGHEFHPSCILTWFTQNTTCPTCRHPHCKRPPDENTGSPPINLQIRAFSVSNVYRPRRLSRIILDNDENFVPNLSNELMNASDENIITSNNVDSLNVNRLRIPNNVNRLRIPNNVNRLRIPNNVNNNIRIAHPSPLQMLSELLEPTETSHHIDWINRSWSSIR